MKPTRIRSRGIAWAASGAVVVCTALGIALFLNAYASLSRAAYRDRAVTYAQAFAASAGSWLARGEVEVAETLAGFLVTGSVRSVEIRDDGGRVLMTVGDAESARAMSVEVPLPAAGGSVRMRIDDSSAVLAVRHAALLAVGAGLLFDALVLALLAWALRGRRAPVDLTAPATEGTGDGRIIIGDLVIVPSRCEASYVGQPLRLTPKQFALLSVLASEPGRVFSESEILAAAWPDSAYADARDIKQYVYLLRRRLAEIRPDGRDAIVTVPGFGYRLDDGR